MIRNDIGAELVSEINLLRTKPAQYADMLRKDRLPYFRRTCISRSLHACPCTRRSFDPHLFHVPKLYAAGNKLVLPGWKKIVPTQEGTKAVQEAIDVLSMTEPMQPVGEWPGMTAAAQEAVTDSGGKGVMKKV